VAPRNDEQNQQIRDERREQLLKAALKVFARRGLAAAKISDIASAAGLSHGLVYHYFSSKDEIFTVLVERALDSSAQLTAYAAHMPGTPLDRIRWMTETILSHRNEEASYFFLIVLQAFTSDAVPEAVKRLVEQKSLLPTRQLIPILEAGQAAGEIAQGNPEQLAVLYFCIIQGLMLSAIQGDRQIAMPPVEMVLRALKPCPEGPAD
jgi:AcrR family transcriptional regulator